MAGTKAQPELRKISIATVRSQAEATALVHKLRAVNIDAKVVAEESFATSRSVRRTRGAFKVQVSSADIKRALHCLQTKEPADAQPSKAQQTGQPGAKVGAKRSESARFAVPLGIACALAIGLALLLLL